MIARGAALVFAAVALIAGCERQAPELRTVETESEVDAPRPSAPYAPAQAGPAAAPPSELAAPQLTPEAEKGEKGARNVLLEWARAIERKDFARAAAQWGEEAKVAVTDEASRFAGMGRLTVTLGEGAVEGGAGSLYFGVPVRVSDGNRTLAGEIVVRRVNDVDGATPAQLRWHVVGITLVP